MFRFKNYIACFLLLLFGRILAPELLVLALHAHEHTVEAPVTKDPDFAFSKKHLHCHTDNLFNAPFAPHYLVIAFSPELTFNDAYLAHYACHWKFTFPNNIDLRGPPAAFRA